MFPLRPLRHTAAPLLLTMFLPLSNALPASSEVHPCEVERFFLTPGLPQELAWSTTLPAGKVVCPITDYTGQRVADCTVDVDSSGAAHTTITLPSGYHELTLGPATFGLLSLEPAPGTPDDFFGMDAVLTWLEPRREMRAALVRDLARSGIGLVRERLRWIGVNPAPDRWDWDERDHADDLRGLYRKQGIQVLEMFHDPGPAAGPFPFPTRYPQDLVQLSRSWPEIHARWQATWAGLEAWNEPDGATYGRGLPADQYVPLVKALRWTWQQHGLTGPLGGGVFIGNDPGAFEDACARNGLLEHCDFVSFHDYRPAIELARKIGRYRTWLRRQGHESLPLWITEAGFPWAQENGRAPREADARSALEIAMKAVEARACGVAHYFPFCLPFFEERAVNSFSLMGQEVTPLRSMAAYAQCARALAHRSYVGDLALANPAILRARVFAPDGAASKGGESLVVLFTGTAGGSRVALPFRPVRVEAIDGRIVQPAADGSIAIEGGLAYVWAAPGAVESRLDRSTEAATLLAASRQRVPTAPAAAAVVLQHLPDARALTYTPGWYLVTEHEARALRIAVRLTNLSGHAQHTVISVHPPAGSRTAPSPRTVTVPPGEAVQEEWIIDLHDGLAVATTQTLTVDGQMEDGTRISPLAIPLRLEGSLDRVRSRFVRHRALPLGDLTRWQGRIVSHGRLQMHSAGDHGWAVNARFTKPGDRWVYPEFRLDPHALVGAGGIVVRLRAHAPAAVRLILTEEGGASYVTPTAIAPADGNWHVAFVGLNDFSPRAAHPENEDGELDPDRVVSLAIGLQDASVGLENRLEVSDVLIVGPLPAGGGNYPLAEAHLFSPPWRGQVSYGEAVALIRRGEDAPADGTLFFTPRKILRVRSSDGRTDYEAGRDYLVDAPHRRLVLPPSSRIPFVAEEALHAPAGSPRSLPHLAGDPSTHLFYAERWFPRVQVEVDYEHDEAWPGQVPSFASSLLPRTVARLRRHAGLTLAVVGDSISAGANASKTVPPFMPAYVTLLQLGLEQACGGRVAVVNLARPRTTAADGAARVSAIVAARPDLVIVAYGMNDTHDADPAAFGARIGSILDGVRHPLPETEFILVAPSRANPEWSWSPAGEFPRYANALRALTGPGVALADLTTLWTDLLARKRYLDLTGNGINHPNDFGHRLHAQALLDLLVAPPAAARS